MISQLIKHVNTELVVLKHFYYPKAPVIKLASFDQKNVCGNAAELLSEEFRNAFAGNAEVDEPLLLVSKKLFIARYNEMKTTLPSKARILYAMKANDHPDLLQAIFENGGGFDCASIGEIEMVREVSPNLGSLCSFSNTNKRRSEIQKAYELGVRLFAADCKEEIDKLADVAPKSKIFFRLAMQGTQETASSAFTTKFGTDIDSAVDLAVYAKAEGLIPYGSSVHVGGQQRDPYAFVKALYKMKDLHLKCEARGLLTMRLVNLGGGFPAKYTSDVLDLEVYGKLIRKTFANLFTNNEEMVVEPGRGLVADAGVIRCRVVTLKRPQKQGENGGLVTDCGPFKGLFETMRNNATYKVAASKTSENMIRCTWVDNTCDSSGVCFQQQPVLMPDTLEEGDEIFVLKTGAYTSSYVMPAFNRMLTLVTKVF